MGKVCAFIEHKLDISWHISKRREVAGRTETQFREDRRRRVNWMAGKVGKRRKMPITVVIYILGQLIGKIKIYCLF